MTVKNKIKFLIISLIVDVLVGIYYFRVSNTILDIGDTDAEAMLTTAIYSVIGDLTRKEMLEYEDFFTIVNNGNGDVASIITNGIAVNMFTGDIVMKICSFLDEYAKQGVNVPAGVFTGIKLLSGFGDNVNFKLVKIASAKCDLVSKFETAGINQVKHSLYAQVTPDVTLKAVGRSRQVIVTVSVLIYENIIVWKVPDTYLNASIVH